MFEFKEGDKVIDKKTGEIGYIECCLYFCVTSFDGQNWIEKDKTDPHYEVIINGENRSYGPDRLMQYVD